MSRLVGGALPEKISSRAFIPFLVASIGLASAYGASFLLADRLRALGYDAAMAGGVVSVGTIATIVCSLLAGKIAERVGVMSTIVVAALAMAAAMGCFAAMGLHTYLAYCGGLFLGIGWSVFYILAPVQLIHHVQAGARIKYLTLLSGSQMLGIGMAPPIGRYVVKFTSFGSVYMGFALACGLAAVLMTVARRVLLREPHQPMTAVRLTWPHAREIMRARTALPVVMIGVNACIFAGLSTFQTLYAESREQSPATFFLVFTITTVILRFSVAPLIGKVPLGKLALTLFLCTLTAVVLLRLNQGSFLLYALATVIFAAGYGLSYSTLNSMVVNMADDLGLSIPVASQVFTISYFIGLFGFPFAAGAIIRHGGVNTVLSVMAGIVSLNICLLLALLQSQLQKQPQKHN